MSLVTSLVRPILLITVFSTAGVLAQSPTPSTDAPPPSPFNGTWKRVGGEDTVSIYLSGDTAIITTSEGGRGTGLFNGESILYSGTVNTDVGPAKSLGTYIVSPDGNTMIKHREIYYQEGKEKEEQNISYERVASESPGGSPGSSSPSAQTTVPTAAPKPTQASRPSATPSEPFVGTWKPADDSAKLTITVNGRNATLKYSPGPRQAGTIRGNKLECDTESNSGGIKSTDVFEMSSNGRTLIRRRALESRSGETGNETLTYNRAE